jgi:hypothetical protein
MSSLSFLLCHPNAEAAQLVIIDKLDSGVFECRLNLDQSWNVARERPFLAFNAPMVATLILAAWATFS